MKKGYDFVMKHNAELRKFHVGTMLSCHAYQSISCGWYSSSYSIEPIMSFIIVSQEFLDIDECDMFLASDELAFTVNTERGRLTFIKDDLIV